VSPDGGMIARWVEHKPTGTDRDVGVSLSEATKDGKSSVSEEAKRIIDSSFGVSGGD